jgi:ADP-L-glycero-D-manno-heptose 6-epimerase
MLVITGAAGFIGSGLVRFLNQAGRLNLVLVDDFSRADKAVNWSNERYIARIERRHFVEWLERCHDDVEAVFHLGARTDTTEPSVELFDELNLNYSKAVWEVCTRHGIPLVYASSAATYGLGELGYTDSHEVVDRLQPLNPYGRSKNDFDRWALQQANTPPHWYGLKFFNVYGPHEEHKGRMASVIFHAYHQIRKTGKMKLFRSHRPDVADGMQQRDFIHVDDVLSMCHFLFTQRPENGLYNIGTGQARSFLDLVRNTFRAMELEPVIEFIDTPADIRDTYQYFTEADMRKLRAAGYTQVCKTLEEGVEVYVKEWLSVL